MSSDSDGGSIPEPYPIVDENPEMDVSGKDLARPPAPKRPLVIDSPTANKAFREDLPTDSDEDQPSHEERSEDAPSISTSSYKTRMVKEMIREDFVSSAKFLWMGYDHAASFSKEQTEVTINFAAFCMTHAVSRIGVEMRKEMEATFKKFHESIKSDLRVLSDKIDEQCQKPRAEPMSYSQVCGLGKLNSNQSTSTSATSQKDEVKETKAAERQCYTVIQPNTPDDAVADRAVLWTEVLSRKAKRDNMKITKVFKTRNDNLAVHFADSTERRKFEEALRKDPIQGAHVRSSADQRVAFAIRGVPAAYDAPSLTREIMERNGHHKLVRQGRPEIMDARVQQEGLADTRMRKTFKLVTTAKDASLLLEDTFFYIGLTRVRVSLWKPSKRCGHCHEIDHSSRNCQNQITCRYCAGNHVSFQCQRRRSNSEHKCIVCHRLGRNSNHVADPDNCEILFKEADTEMKNIFALIKANHG